MLRRFRQYLYARVTVWYPKATQTQVDALLVGVLLGASVLALVYAYDNPRRVTSDDITPQHRAHLSPEQLRSVGIE